MNNQIFPGAQWEHKTLKEANVNEQQIGEMFRLIATQNKNIHAVALIKDGYKIFEHHTHPFQPEYPRHLCSCSKAYMSIAIGMLVKEKRLSVTDRIFPFFADNVKAYADAIDSRYQEMTVRDLLTMASGQDPEDIIALSSETDWVKAFFTTKLLHTPGTIFRYGGHQSYILSAIVQKITGKRLFDYLDENLFCKIGIPRTCWKTHNGIDLGTNGLYFAADAMARLGWLMLNDGMWNGEQLVDKDYCIALGEKQIDIVPLFNDWEGQVYSYQLWVYTDIEGYKASGNFGQVIFMMKQYNAVWVLQCGEEEDVTRIAHGFVEPALRLGYTVPYPKLAACIQDYENKEELFDAQPVYLPENHKRYNGTYRLDKRVDYNTYADVYSVRFDSIRFSYDGTQLAVGFFLDETVNNGGDADEPANNSSSADDASLECRNATSAQDAINLECKNATSAQDDANPKHAADPLDAMKWYREAVHSGNRYQANLNQMFQCGLHNRYIENTVGFVMGDCLTESHFALKAWFSDDTHLTIAYQGLEEPPRMMFHVEFLEGDAIRMQAKLYEKCSHNYDYDEMFVGTLL